MVTELTGTRTRPLFNGDMIVVKEPEPRAFGWGAGTIVGRWPVAAHLEDELREKLASKMTVTALLAGFVLTALVELAVNMEDFDWVEAVSVGLLTLSLCLLIASVYIYDQLGMPEGFWTDGPRPKWLSTLNRRKERHLDKLWSDRAANEPAELVEDGSPFASLVRNGPMFTYMVRTHRVLFTPGVVAGGLGIGAVLEVNGNGWPTAIFVGAALLSACWYLAVRPAFGVD